MSTRRARIKAVAALPPRRKNLENDAKSKLNSAEDNSEAVLKSPRTPRSQASKSDDKNSPSIKRSPPGLIPLGSVSETPACESVPSPKPVPATEESTPATEESTQSNTSQTSEKVPVITPVSLIKNVFASPLVKGSPRRISSPIIPPSPKRRKISEVAASPVPPVVQNSSESGSSQASQSNEKVISTPTGGKKSDVPDDYSISSIPESVTDEAEVDGIVLLQSNQKAAKPIELLKNEIISDYADVSFDPIVPLPSPSKVRPKLRPVPRLAPHRRNSIQGSASESEDESRRALLSAGTPTPVPPRQRQDSHTSHSTMHSLPVHKDMNRIRNDSVSSNISQVAVTQPPPATSPVKEKHFSKTRRNEMSRRSWLRRRGVKRDALTMYDLIFYNPTTNPIIPDQEEVKAKAANAKEEAERSAKAADSEEEVDDPPATDAAPVPQIKLGPNGEIVLDEKSLVIKQSDARKVSSVVREGSWVGGAGRYSRASRTADWSSAETVRFYRALAAIGTDFSLMAPLFPDRNRKDLYLKFKKEERLNGAQVDKALRSATSWDASRLQTEFKQEREDAKKRKEAEQQQLLENKKAERERIKSLKETKIRNSRGSRALEFSVKPGARSSELTADDLADRAIQRAHAEINRSIRHNLKPQKEPAKPALDTSNPSFATLTLLANTASREQSLATPMGSLATISRVNPPNSTTPVPVNLNSVSGVPSNIETGSLVVLRVNDPKSPSKTMLQTYIAHGADKLTPVALPSTFLNSVVGYMKKGTPKSTISSASSPLMSPNSVTSQGSRSGTPSVIQLNPSPVKKKRHTSYTITPM